MKKIFDFEEIVDYSISQLVEFCKKKNIPDVSGKLNMLHEILKTAISKCEIVYFSAYFEPSVNKSFGFLRNAFNNFDYSPCDIYVPTKLIKEHYIRPGDLVKCEIGLSKSEEQKCFIANKIISINGRKSPFFRPFFKDFIPTYPDKQIILEKKIKDEYILPNRTIDLICSIGFGQRCLVVAPPKGGKTTILHGIGTSIITNYPEISLIVLLICERPEEVTEMKKILPQAMIIFSTFDESNENQVRAAEMVEEIAKRRVEEGKDVVILLDSITRLTRAYNAITPSSGKILSGGVEPTALYKPKRFFGSARNVEEGSLTIIATALKETGSKMDSFIYEEFVGTGNSDIVLDRALANKRIFPAIDINSSATRRREVMLDSKTNEKLNTLQFFLAGKNYEEGVRFLYQQIKTTQNNKILLEKMSAAPVL